jgi:FkbM family methyltransferase
MIDTKDFKKAIRSAVDERDARLDLLQKYKDLPIALFGYGNKGKQFLYQMGGLESQIHIYDVSPVAREQASQDGYDVINSLESLVDFQVVLGSGQSQLDQKNVGIDNYMFYEEATYFYDLVHVQSPARVMSDVISENADEFYELYDLLQDDSKNEFLAVLLFRASLNPTHLQKTRIDNSQMWLDVPRQFKSRNYRSFLDVGAFDGDTIATTRATFEIERAHAVEANAELIPKIAQQASSFKDGLILYPYAAWSRNCMLSCIADHNSMFNIVEDDKGEVCAAKLDALLSEKIDLLKMDIEGSELQALKGCERLLSSCPDALIAAYHRPLDFLEISSFMLEQNRKYRVHFRHYSDVYDDSILYFLV